MSHFIGNVLAKIKNSCQAVALTFIFSSPLRRCPTDKHTSTVFALVFDLWVETRNGVGACWIHQSHANNSFKNYKSVYHSIPTHWTINHVNFKRPYKFCRVCCMWLGEPLIPWLNSALLATWSLEATGHRGKWVTGSCDTGWHGFQSLLGQGCQWIGV